jgi:hypothetical protein
MRNRNRFPGTCDRCKQLVLKGAGYFELQPGRWGRTVHAHCTAPLRSLLTEVAALKRYDHAARPHGPRNHITLNMPRELFERIDEALKT